jgi:hypothetical protein
MVNGDVFPTEAVELTLNIRFSSLPLSSVEKLFIDTEIVFSVLAYRICALHCVSVNSALQIPNGSRMPGSNWTPIDMLVISFGGRVLTRMTGT